MLRDRDVIDERFAAYVRERGEHHLRVAVLLTGDWHTADVHSPTRQRVDQHQQQRKRERGAAHDGRLGQRVTPFGHTRREPARSLAGLAAVSLEEPAPDLPQGTLLPCRLPLSPRNFDGAGARVARANLLTWPFGPARALAFVASS